MHQHRVLYVSNDCVQCGRVVDYLQRKEIDLLIVNVDDEGDSPPNPAFIYPVLYINNELCAYGLDIIEHFQLATNRP